MIVWLDLETTGLNPRQDRILELALYMASVFDPAPEHAEPKNYVLHFDVAFTFGGISPFVREMHTKNGLWAECAESNLTVHALERELLTVLPADEKLTLAGNSIHFDKGFLEHWMPELATRFSHRLFDVSAVKLFAEHMCQYREPKADSTHRASADVKASIRQARRIAEHVWAGWLRGAAA